jgi:hypothetical protein
MTMTYRDANLSELENIGSLDRVNRMIVALTLIAVAVVFTAIPPAAVFILAVLSIYAGLTAATGWDPLFVVVKALQQRAPEQTVETLTPRRRREDQAAVGGYRQAA